jgi:hypothetical protein
LFAVLYNSDNVINLLVLLTFPVSSQRILKSCTAILMINCFDKGKVKGKAIPVTGRGGP